MFCIKFRKKKRISIKFKIEIINKLTTFFEAEPIEMYYSDYTFDKVNESKTITWTGSIWNIEAYDKFENPEKFITMLCNTKNKDILRIEINPKIAKKEIYNCPNIEFSLDSNTSLYAFSNEKIIKEITTFLDNHREFISEFYFYNINKIIRYGDIKNRYYQKQYDPIEFGDLLFKQLDSEYNLIDTKKPSSDKKFSEIKNYNSSYEKIEKINNRSIIYKFTQQIMANENKEFINNMINENNFGTFAEIGSLVLYGKDIDNFIDELIRKMKKYRDNINEKDIYRKEFKKLFQRS